MYCSKVGSLERLIKDDAAKWIPAEALTGTKDTTVLFLFVFGYMMQALFFFVWQLLQKLVCRHQDIIIKVFQEECKN